jgi:predicted XRE-type DNA-binding protein
MNNEKELEFEKYLEKIEDPNYQGYVNKDLPKNADFISRLKFKLCQEMINYQQKNKLNLQEIADKVNLTIPEVNEILFCYIDNFTLDRLAAYADRLFSYQLEFQITST